MASIVHVCAIGATLADKDCIELLFRERILEVLLVVASLGLGTRQVTELTVALELRVCGRGTGTKDGHG